MAGSGLPEGVFYPSSNCVPGEEGEWVQFSGGSNAQSSLIQLFDIMLGIQQECGFFEVRTTCYFDSTDTNSTDINSTDRMVAKLIEACLTRI